MSIKLTCISLCFAALMHGAACRSTAPRQQQAPVDDSTASILINAGEPDKIYAAVADVFASKGFNLMTAAQSGWVFQRPGTRADSHRFGDYDSSAVMMQATIVVVPYGNQWLVQCNLVAIRDYNDPLGGDTNPIPRGFGYHREYEDMLAAAKKMLTQK
jgi:hypothetical protein